MRYPPGRRRGQPDCSDFVRRSRHNARMSSPDQVPPAQKGPEADEQAGSRRQPRYGVRVAKLADQVLAHLRAKGFLLDAVGVERLRYGVKQQGLQFARTMDIGYPYALRYFDAAGYAEEIINQAQRLMHEQGRMCSGCSPAIGRSSPRLGKWSCSADPPLRRVADRRRPRAKR